MIEKIQRYLHTQNLMKTLDLQDPITVTFLAQGEYNQNFLVADAKHKYVFRLNYGSQLQLKHQILYEYHALKWLEVSGQTPKVFYVDDSRNYFEQGLLIMAFLSGEPLNYQRDLLKAAQIFGHIHQLALDTMASKYFIEEKNILADRIKECQYLLQPVQQSRVLSTTVKTLLNQALKRCQAHRQDQKFFNQLALWRLNNTEVNSHNFIIGKRSWLIDWEKPVISHPVQDISQFLASTTTLWRDNIHLSQAQKWLFLDRYLQITGFDRQAFLTALRIYQPYLMLRALSWSAMAYDNYQTGQKALQNQEIFNRVKSYMEPDFLAQTLQEQVFTDA